MKKIIMMILVVATALSGIMVPTKKADALVVSNNEYEAKEQIMELLGYNKPPFNEPFSSEANDAFSGCQFCCIHANISEILWLADKDGNIIVDDRKIGILTDVEMKRAERNHEFNKEILYNNMRSASIPFHIDYSSVDVIEGFTEKLYCADPYDAANKGTPYLDAVWSSDNPDIAEVAKDGTVTAKKPGKAVIRAVVSENGKEVTRKINVIKNQWEGKYKISKGRIKDALSYDKMKKSILWKATIKNTGKKKYKYTGEISIYNHELRGHTLTPVVLKKYKYKAVLKPGKSKTLKGKKKKLSKYEDLTSGAVFFSVDNNYEPCK